MMIYVDVYTKRHCVLLHVRFFAQQFFFLSGLLGGHSSVMVVRMMRMMRMMMMMMMMVRLCVYPFVHHLPVFGPWMRSTRHHTMPLVPRGKGNAPDLYHIRSSGDMDAAPTIMMRSWKTSDSPPHPIAKFLCGLSILKISTSDGKWESLQSFSYPKSWDIRAYGLSLLYNQHIHININIDIDINTNK